MKLQEVKEILQANTWVGHDKLDDIEVTHAAATDLMSELLRLDGDGALLLTGLN
ncbi:MAG: hypothetical protein JRH06_14715, partial [Deltaproteobacteria bacterium]|nr:hypothetical protein [Deltaproteobacteria bacterium]